MRCLVVLLWGVSFTCVVSALGLLVYDVRKRAHEFAECIPRAHRQHRLNVECPHDDA